jgi:Cu/Ag efflux protein CusF
MRKHLVLSLALLLVLVTAVSAAAKTSSSTKSKYHRTNGDITATDPSAQTFTITHGKETSTFKTDGSTKFRGLGKTISFSDLKVGDNVRVSYTESGTDKTAARVDVLHGKKSG